MASNKWNSIVGSSVVAKLFGLSTRRIQQLAKDETISSVTENNKNLKFDLYQVVPEYLELIVKDAKEKSAASELEKYEIKKSKADAELKSHRARKAKLEADELEGEMHRSADVEDMTTKLVYSVKNSLLALPGKLAIDLARIDKPTEISKIVEREVYEILNELANYEYNPQDYRDKVRERIGWQIDHDQREQNNAAGNSGNTTK